MRRIMMAERVGGQRSQRPGQSPSHRL